MEPRLSELTEQMRAREARADLWRAAFVLLKGASDPDAAHQALTRFKSVKLDAVFKTGVSAGGQESGQWGYDLGNFTVLAREWLMLLSKRTVVGKLATIPVPVNRRVVVETSTTVASFVAGGAALPAQAFSLNATALLQNLKLGFIVGFVNESFEVWNSATMANIEARCTLGVQRGMDREFLDVDAAAATGTRPGSVLNGLSPVASIANSAASALAGVEAVLGEVVDSGCDLENVALVMHPRTFVAFAALQGSSANAAFPGLALPEPNIFGVRVLTSTACVRSGSPNERFIGAIDASRIAVADAGQLDISAGRYATVQFDDAATNNSITPTNTTQVSAWQTNSTMLRVTRYINWLRCDDSACAWATSAI